MIVGSAALQFHGINLREPKDIDHWIPAINPKPPCREGNAEFHNVPRQICDLVPRSMDTTDYQTYATPDAIYTIKCSHAGWDIHWQKTMADIMALRKLGCKKIPELYDALYKYWLVHHDGKKYFSLDRTKDEFFNNYVNYVVDHDKLHAIVASPNRPLYTKVLKEKCEVLVDKAKFDRLSENDKLNLFLEEICVIALERWVIPSKFEYSKRKAYQNALKKTIVSLTKNWATEFIVDNYEFYVKNTNWEWYNKAEGILSDEPRRN